jgi:catechol 2,3-dioxygenase-like lactoylglutathione lyase family enzyme
MPELPTSNPKQFYQGAPVLSVPDVGAAAAFYRTKLGFSSDPEGETPEYTVVWRDNAAVHLAKGDFPASGVKLFFWVKDVNALHEEIVKRNVPIDVPIDTRDYGIRDFSVRDPNGVVVVFGQDWD